MIFCNPTISSLAYNLKKLNIFDYIKNLSTTNTISNKTDNIILQNEIIKYNKLSNKYQYNIFLLK